MKYGVLAAAISLTFLCWLLAGRTRRVGIEVGMALGVIAVLAAAVLHHQILESLAVTLTFTLAVAMVAVLAWGLWKDRRATASLPRSRRVFVGRIVAVVYCATVVVGLLVAGVVIGSEGRTADVPATESVLPLPKSLGVADTSDQGCDGDTSTVCLREVDVVPAAGGDADGSTVQTILTSLAKHHGWHLKHDTSGGNDEWASCRTVGYLLDRVHECVEVYTHNSQAVILISEDDRW